MKKGNVIMIKPGLMATASGNDQLPAISAKYRTRGVTGCVSIMGNNATVCRNMRQSTDDSGLVPVGMPKEIAEGNGKPFFLFRDSNGKKTLFLKSGNIVSYISLDAENRAAKELATLPSEPYCATASGETVIIMTSEGGFRVYHDEETDKWSAAGLMPSLPAISIIASSTATFSSTIPARVLSGGYTRSQGNLTAADTNAISGDLLNAYNDICTKASNAGYYVQPVMACYRLYDKDGVMLYESAPVLVSTPSGFQCTEAIATTINASSGIFSNADPYTLKATGFKLGIVSPELAESPWGETVAAVEITVTPQLHPVDFLAKASNRLEPSNATQGILRMYLPGTANGMVASTAQRDKMTIATAERMEMVASPIMLYAKPFAGGISATAGEIIETSCITMLTPAEETKRHRQQLSTKVPGRDRLLQDTNSPHSFTARTATATGDLITWGDITPRLFDGYAAGTFAATTGGGRWRACIKTVSGSRGETVVWHGEGESNAPLTFSPLLSYPHPDATEMTIKVSYDDGRTLSGKFPLKPSPNRRMAYYLSPEGKPIALDTELEAYVIPAEERKAERHPGTIMCSRTVSPTEVNSVLEVSQGRIATITPAVRSSSSWDFARTHLYAFTTTGIYAVSVSGTRKAIAANIIDPRGVAGEEAVTYNNDNVYAIADGQAIKVHGSQSETIDSQTGFKSIGWSGALNELWFITHDGKSIVYQTDYDGYYFRDTPEATSLFSAGGELFALAGNKILNLSSETENDRQQIEWKSRLAIDGTTAPLHRTNQSINKLSSISWRIFSANADIKLSLRGDGGAGEANSYPMLALGVKGSINNPISARVIAPARPYITFAVSGKPGKMLRVERIEVKGER